MVKRPRGDEKARPDELGTGRRDTGTDSAGQSGDTQQLSDVEDAADESVEELVEEDQPFEAAAIEGVEDAGDHPERPVHTHDEYGRPEDGPGRRKRSA